MSLLDADKKETIHLWIAIAISVILALYRSLTLLPASSSICQIISPLPSIVYISMSIFIVLLLWLAYRRWSETINRREELEFVIKTIGPDMIMVIDTKMIITMCNHAVEEIFGYTTEEVIGQKTSMLYFDRRITGDKKEIYNRITTIGIHAGFAKGKRKDGRIIPLEIITGELPNQPGAVILIRDITERKEFEDQLIKAKEKAEDARIELEKTEHMRDSLTNMIVHDLKSPLTAISGYLELISRAPDNNLNKEYTEFMSEACRITHQLGDMINSLLDISRLEAHEMPLNKHILDIKEVCSKAMEIIGPDGRYKKLKITLPPDTTLAFGDKDVIQRIIMNLVNNAIKFTPVNGAITVTTETEDNFVKVRVTDTGTGIPKEFHEKIFSKFAQIEAKKFSTGIGLTFCKLAVEAHGGTIGVNSETGKGSTLWFTIPATPQDN
jgi:PAS domain S-box-containing protein